MKTFTFEVINRDPLQDSLYDIFSKSVVDKPVQRMHDVVRENEEGRLDLVSLRVYGTTDKVEELMVINNILNPFSIQSGEPIDWVYRSQLDWFNEKDKELSISEKVANPKNKKDTRKDPSRQTGVPPTIRPVDFEQMIVDKKNKTIKLNTKLS